MDGDNISWFFILRVQSYRIKKLCKTSENNNTISIERKNTQYESVDMINNKLENSKTIDKTILNTSKNDIAYKNEKIKQIEINKKHIEKVNYFHILKSYFCFKWLIFAMILLLKICALKKYYKDFII